MTDMEVGIEIHTAPQFLLFFNYFTYFDGKIKDKLFEKLNVVGRECSRLSCKYEEKGRTTV